MSEKFTSVQLKTPDPKTMFFQIGQWVKIICKAHKNLTGKKALVIGHSPDRFYLVIYNDQSLIEYYKTGICLSDGYFGYSQLVTTDYSFEQFFENISIMKNRINLEFTEAFKAKDIFKKDTLGVLKSKITEFEKKKNTIATNEDVYGIILTAIKQREQAIEVYNSNTSEQAKTNAQKESEEILILKQFLPRPFNDNELKEAISLHITKLFSNNQTISSKDIFNAVMKEFNSPALKPMVDSKKLKPFTEEAIEVLKQINPEYETK